MPDSSHWNTIANLHLLNDSQNLSKSDRPLKEWLEDSSVHLTAANLLVEGVDLGFEAFGIFCRAQGRALKVAEKSCVYSRSLSRLSRSLKIRMRKWLRMFWHD